MSTSTSKKSAKKEPNATSSQMDPQAQLREIQDLLFGQQVAEVRQSIETLSEQSKIQFADMDKKITSSIKELKTHFNNQLDDLTKHVNQLNDEASNRSGLIEGDLSGLQQQVDGFEKQTIAAQDALESQLLAEVDKLTSELEKKSKEILKKLNHSSGELADEKVSREALAKLLVNVANNLETQPS